MNSRFFLTPTLLFAANLFFCGVSTAASTGTLTLRFGQTTEGSFEIAHPDAVKVGINKVLNGAIYQMAESDLLFDGTKHAFVLFDHNENLVAIYSQFKSNFFAILGTGLAKKYTTIINKKSIIGGGYLELYNEGVSIYLLTPSFFSGTSLLYIKSDIKERFLENISPKVLEDEGDMLDLLVKKCFSPPIKL